MLFDATFMIPSSCLSLEYSINQLDLLTFVPTFYAKTLEMDLFRNGAKDSSQATSMSTPGKSGVTGRQFICSTLLISRIVHLGEISSTDFVWLTNLEYANCQISLLTFP
ncbi:hypothetical protein FPOAC2_10660 [Fusarium poae]